MDPKETRAQRAARAARVQEQFARQDSWEVAQSDEKKSEWARAHSAYQAAYDARMAEVSSIEEIEAALKELASNK